MNLHVSPRQNLVASGLRRPSWSRLLVPSGAAGCSKVNPSPCVSLGIDKENVELSPTAGHTNSGRMRHGSASQVQKQRSAGSFKRHSIKKIV